MTKKEIEEVRRKLSESRARRVAWVNGTDVDPNRIPLPEPDVPLICGPRTKEEADEFFKKLAEGRLADEEDEET